MLSAKGREGNVPKSFHRPAVWMQVRTFGIFLQRIERVSHTTLTNQLQSGSGHPVEYIYFLRPVLELVGEGFLKLECSVGFSSMLQAVD